ncbi:MAG: GGDEF domain-containing response regulator [Spirochaetota bacterium]
MGETYAVLVVTQDPDFSDSVYQAVSEDEYSVRVVSSRHEALSERSQERQNEELQIVVIDLDLPADESWFILGELRRRHFREPLQILLSSANKGEAFIRRALDGGGDDFVGKPVGPLEMRVRLRAATIRLNQQRDLHYEREFYRRAVKQEEELSSRVLDQNLQLRKAYDEISGVNRELERANQELERVAHFDVLSGLMNRMSLFAALDVEIERSLRSGMSLCGIMIDIDHFKEVNDNLGHGCGDKVISALGRVFLEELRKYDHAGRYGGEEFFIALPNSSIHQASMFAERVRSNLEQLSVECEDARTSITVSMGIAKFRHGESRDMWISRADRAMYVAKQKGRNCIETEPQ